MAGRVEGKVALITGGASGIGRACAERLAQEGATVVVTDLQDAKGAEVVAAIRAAGGKAEYLHHDVTQEQAWIEVIAAINVDGVFLGLKHAIPLIREGKAGGSIINMSSIAGLKGSPRMSGYCATKGAVRLMTKSVAMECAGEKDGIRVNSMHPGIIETPIWDSIIGTGDPGDNARPARPAVLDALTADAVPLGVKGYPEDIANGVLWLASDESRYVTGAEMVIDGGLTVK